MGEESYLDWFSGPGFSIAHLSCVWGSILGPTGSQEKVLKPTALQLFLISHSKCVLNSKTISFGEDMIYSRTCVCAFSVMSDSLQPHGLSSTRLLCPTSEGSLQLRILEWVAISSSRGSSQPRDQTWVFCISCAGRWILYYYTTWETCRKTLGLSPHPLESLKELECDFLYQIGSLLQNSRTKNKHKSSRTNVLSPNGLWCMRK